MFAFLLIVQSVVGLALIAVILMQRSEGGGLGVGGSSSGFMTARGASEFLTRSPAILGGLFIILSIGMAAIAGVSRQTPTLDASLANKVQSSRPAPVQPQPQTQPAAPGSPTAPSNQDAPAVPLAQ